MLTTYTENQKVRIINNVVRAANGDIEKLTNASYKFLHLSSGFIAHYDRYSFIVHYSTPGLLRRDILINRRMNQWLNFRPGERDYDYYMSKADIYQRICDQLI